MVVCAGRQTMDYRGSDGFLEAENLHTLPQNYAQWTWDVMSGETIADVLRRAFMFAEAPPDGPTFVTFSHDLWADNVKWAEIIPRSRFKIDQQIPPPESHLNKIVNNLLEAELPVLFLGFDTTSGILGWGLAAAIGTKIGNPNREVWCLTGDGSFNFGSQALWSAARYEVPIGIVVFNNGQYQANRLTQIRAGGKRIQKSGKYIGVSLGHPDINYVSMSEAYGIEGERVSDPKKLAGALKRCRRAMQEGRPYVVDVIIAKRFEGKDSDYYDFFSVAKMQNT